MRWVYLLYNYTHAHLLCRFFTQQNNDLFTTLLDVAHSHDRQLTSDHMRSMGLDPQGDRTFLMELVEHYGIDVVLMVDNPCCPKWISSYSGYWASSSTVGAVFESIIDSKPCTVVILLNHKSKIRSVVAFQSIMIYVLWPMFCLWYHVVWMIEIWHLMTNVHKQWIAMLNRRKPGCLWTIYIQCKNCFWKYTIPIYNVLNLVQHYNMYKKYCISRIISYDNVSHKSSS